MRASTRTQLIIVCFIYTVSQFGYIYVFPILPDITQDFFPHLSESELGYRQGYLAGIYFLGNFFGALFWGKVSDKIGRKGGFILSTSLYTTCIAIFGLSVSFSMALVMRFLWGLFNGLDTIVKTFAAEISENNRDLAQSISAFGLTDGIGRLLGPTISAWLSRPADKVSWLDNEFLRRFPYFLPSMMCVGLALVAILVSAALMKETLIKGNNVESRVAGRKYALLETTEKGGSSGSEEDEKVQLTRSTPESTGHSDRTFLLERTLNTFRPLAQRSVLTAILVYNMYCFIVIQLDELISLMLVTSPANGGFCMNESGLGFITFCVSFLQIPWALIVNPFIISRLGVRRSLRVFLVLFAILVFLMPLWSRNRMVENSFTNAILSSSSNNFYFSTSLISLSGLNASESDLSYISPGVSLASCSGVRLGITDIPAKVWLIFFTVYIPIALCRMTIFVCCTIAVANSARREERATVNGVSQSGAAIMRLIGPIFSANIYAWSISIGYGWPIDATFIWSLGCIQLLLLLAISFLYSPQVEHPIDSQL